MDVLEVAADSSSIAFDFQPSKVPGVQSHVNFEKQLDSLEEIVNEEVVQANIDINDFALAKFQLDKTAKKYSLYGN